MAFSSSPISRSRNYLSINSLGRINIIISESGFIGLFIIDRGTNILSVLLLRKEISFGREATKLRNSSLGKFITITLLVGLSRMNLVAKSICAGTSMLYYAFFPFGVPLDLESVSESSLFPQQLPIYEFKLLKFSN